MILICICLFLQGVCFVQSIDEWVDVFESAYQHGIVGERSQSTFGDADDILSIVLSSSLDQLFSHSKSEEFIVLSRERLRLAVDAFKHRPERQKDSLIDRIHKFKLLLGDPDLIVKNQSFCKQCHFEPKRASLFPWTVSMPTYTLTAIQIIIVAVLFTYVLSTNRISLQRQARSLFLATFIISVFWNWYNLYLKALAKNRAQLLGQSSIQPGSQCDRDSKSITKMATRAFKNIFFYGGADDECLKYHEALLVSPLSEVSPTQALSFTLVKFCIEPAHLFGKAMADLIAGSCQNVPLFMQPLTITISLASLMFMILVISGYSFKIPFLLSIDSSKSSKVNTVVVNKRSRGYQLMRNQCDKGRAVVNLQKRILKRRKRIHHTSDYTDARLSSFSSGGELSHED